MIRIFKTALLLLWTLSAFAQQPAEKIRKEFLDPDSKTVLVAAHRAAHLKHPENSLPAVREAISLGADIVELDVKVSKDGIPVLMHDRTIDRTTTGAGDPESYSLAELKQFRLIHQGDTTDERIPTFEEVLSVTKDKIMIDIDLKTDRLAPIIATVRKAGCEKQVFFFDSDYDALQQVRDDDPNLYLMPRAYSYEMADSAIVRFKPQVIHIDFSFYNAEVTKLIKSNHARIWINALGNIDPAFGTDKENEALDKTLKFGANIIQTDQPKLLLEALRKRNLHD